MFFDCRRKTHAVLSHQHLNANSNWQCKGQISSAQRTETWRPLNIWFRLSKIINNNASSFQHMTIFICDFFYFFNGHNRKWQFAAVCLKMSWNPHKHPVNKHIRDYFTVLYSIHLYFKTVISNNAQLQWQNVNILFQEASFSRRKLHPAVLLLKTHY